MSRGHCPDRETYRETRENIGPPLWYMTSPIVTHSLVHSRGVFSATPRQCLLTEASTSGVVEEEDRHGEMSSLPAPWESSSRASGSGVCALRTNMYDSSSTGSWVIGDWGTVCAIVVDWSRSWPRRGGNLEGSRRSASCLNPDPPSGHPGAARERCEDTAVVVAVGDRHIEKLAIEALGSADSNDGRARGYRGSSSAASLCYV